jgi:transcription elongation factor Elf1
MSSRQFKGYRRLSQFANEKKVKEKKTAEKTADTMSKCPSCGAVLVYLQQSDTKNWTVYCMRCGAVASSNLGKLSEKIDAYSALVDKVTECAIL